jgi:hypothetical protein
MENILENFTIDHLESGITKAVNGLGQEVFVREVNDRTLLAQGIRLAYYKPITKTITYLTANGKMWDDRTTKLDIYVIPKPIDL